MLSTQLAVLAAHVVAAHEADAVAWLAHEPAAAPREG